MPTFEPEILAKQNKAEADEAFQSFMDRPMTKISISLIPASEHPEVLKCLLQAAFSSGQTYGAISVLKPLMEKMIKRDERR